MESQYSNLSPTTWRCQIQREDTSSVIDDLKRWGSERAQTAGKSKLLKAILAVCGLLLFADVWQRLSKAQKQCFYAGLGSGTILLLLASWKPYVVTHKLTMSLTKGGEKLPVFCMGPLLNVVLHVSSLYSFAGAMEELLAQHHPQYCALNIGFFVVAALTEMVAAGNEFLNWPIPKMALYVCCAASFFQCAHVLALVLAFVDLLMSDAIIKGKKSPATISGSIVSAVNVTKVLYFSGPSAMVCLYSVLNDPAAAGKATKTSVVLNCLSFAKAYAELDLRGRVSRRVKGLPLCVGVQDQFSTTYLMLMLLRWCSTCSRGFLICAFQLCTKRTFSFNGVAYGAAIIVGIDAICQCALAQKASGKWSSVHQGLASVLTPFEPLLHGGEPILSINPSRSAWAHAAELWIVACTAAWYKDEWATLLSQDLIFSCLIVTMTVLQWPLMHFIRTHCAYNMEGLLVVGDLKHGKKEEVLSKNSPVILSGLVGMGLDFKEAHLELMTCKNPLLFVEVLAHTLTSDGCHTEDLTAYGLPGADAALILAKPVEKNRSLEKIHFNFAGLGEEGGTALVQAIRCNPKITELSIRGSNLGPRGASEVAAILDDFPPNRSFLMDVQCKSLREGEAALQASTTKNPNLTVIGLQCNVHVTEIGHFPKPAGKPICAPTTYMGFGEADKGSPGIGNLMIGKKQIEVINNSGYEISLKYDKDLPCDGPGAVLQPREKDYIGRSGPICLEFNDHKMESKFVPGQVYIIEEKNDCLVVNCYA